MSLVRYRYLEQVQTVISEGERTMPSVAMDNIQDGGDSPFRRA